MTNELCVFRLFTLYYRPAYVTFTLNLWQTFWIPLELTRSQCHNYVAMTNIASLANWITNEDGDSRGDNKEGHFLT